MLIIVEDTNDNTPVFTALPTEAVRVREDQEPAVIATLRAEDSDSGAFGQVRKEDRTLKSFQEIASRKLRASEK